MKLQRNLEPTKSIALSTERGTLLRTALQAVHYFAFITKDLFKQFVRHCCPILLSQHTVLCSLNGCFHWCLVCAHTFAGTHTVSQAYEKTHTAPQIKATNKGTTVGTRAPCQMCKHAPTKCIHILTKQTNIVFCSHTCR